VGAFSKLIFPPGGLVFKVKKHLNDYLTQLKNIHADVGGETTMLEFSLSAQLKRAIFSIGLKTQLVLINSLIGTIAVISILLQFQIKISLEAFIGIGFVSLALFCLFHAIIVWVWVSIQKNSILEW